MRNVTSETITKAFLDYDMEMFYLMVICFHNAANNEWNMIDWEAIVLKLKAKYQTYISQNL